MHIIDLVQNTQPGASEVTLFVVVGLVFLSAWKIWMSLTLWTITNPETRAIKYNQYQGHAEVTINIPPLLGILGTLGGLVCAVIAQTTAGVSIDLNQIISANFDSAALTTIGSIPICACNFILRGIDHQLGVENEST